jgi:hypothetical protein
MPPNTDAVAAEGLPAEGASAAAESAGWALAAPAPEPDGPVRRDRNGAALGMTLLLTGGGLFWASVAAILLLSR